MGLGLIGRPTVSTVPIISLEAFVSGIAPKEVVLIMCPAPGTVTAEAPAAF